MGRIRDIGTAMLCEYERANSVNIPRTERTALVLGTGFSMPEVLANQGFVEETSISFAQLCIRVSGNGTGHPNTIKVGTWNDKPVVISMGRVHLNQQVKTKDPILRKWMGVIIALMGDCKRIVLACSVGGIGKSITEGMLLQPDRIDSADSPNHTYLEADEREFVLGEQFLWLNEPISGIRKPKVDSAFASAAMKAGFLFRQCTKHRFITGPGFGGVATQQNLALLFFDSIGMSLDPELRLLAVEYIGITDPSEWPRVVAACLVTDTVPLPDHDKIQEAARDRAGKLGEFLSVILAADW